MHETALLVLGDLDVGEPDESIEPLLRNPQPAGELARKIDRGPAPQLAEQVVPHQRTVVVEAFGAERLAQARIAVLMDGTAGMRDAVPTDGRVAAWPTAARPAVRSDKTRMDRTKAGR